MRILGIETSCDETGFAIYDEKEGLLAHQLHSQAQLHQAYGGVVPELASRDHIRKLIPLLSETLKESDISPKSITGVAYTKGPGLIGALLVGGAFAKSLSYAWGVPAIGIHHMEGHLLAALMEQPKLEFPFLALLVSGAHSMIIKVNAIGEYQVIGDTLDDAAGEAFDKVAKLLGLQYPGGPAIAEYATKGDPSAYALPRPLTDRENLNFSFSGLKTHTLLAFKKSDKTEKTKKNIAASFQAAVVETLTKKCLWATKQTKINKLVIAGGVGANLELRKSLCDTAKASGIEICYPKLEFCTDNGAMIAFAGLQRLKKGQHDPNLAITALPRWEMANIKS